MRRYSPANPGPVACSFARYVTEHYGLEISPAQAQAFFSFHDEWQRWRNAPGGEAEQQKQVRETQNQGTRPQTPEPLEPLEPKALAHGDIDRPNGRTGHHQEEAHVAPINKFVAQLQDRDGRGWMPEIPPTCGGVRARVLTVLRDPGKYTLRSGLLSIENRDPTTTAQMALFDKFGIPYCDVLPWNAYPWYIDRKPAKQELDAGAVVLADLVDLAPHLRVVLLQGNEAAAAWDRVVRSRPRLVEQRGLEVLKCIHPSPQALWTNDATQREARKLKQQRAYERVAKILAISPANG